MFGIRSKTARPFFAACLAGLVLWAGAGQADEAARRAHVGYGAGHPLVQGGWRAFLDGLARTPAAPKIELFLNGPPPDAPESIDGLARGDYALGSAALPAFRDRFPQAALLAELGLAAGDDELAAAAAATELLALDCASCVRAFGEQGIVFMGAYSAARYVLISTEAAGPRGFFRDRVTLTPGSPWDRLVVGLGGATPPTARGAGEMFAAGEIQAAIETPMALADPDVWARARHVLTGPLGAFRAGGAFLASGHYWRELEPAGRRALLDATADGLVGVLWGYRAMAAAALRGAAARGLVVEPASPELAEAMRAIADEDIRRIVATSQERFSIADAARIHERFLFLYDKFSVLLADVENAEAAARILRQEIFDRIDVESYGMEQG